MRFNSDEQRAAVCNRLCEAAQIRTRMWRIIPPGPTDAAKHVKTARPLLHPSRFGLSRSSNLIVLAAWDIWDGSGDVRIGALLEGLDPPVLRILAAALKAIAAGPEAIDDWLLYGTGRMLRAVRADDDPRAFPAVQPGKVR